MNKVEVKKLANGIRVICKPLPGLKAVTIEVLVAVGSKYEKVGEHGLSHFLEHMMFKGTEKRPNTKIISEELDAIGGEYNAFTAKDKTLYYAKVDSKHCEPNSWHQRCDRANRCRRQSIRRW